MIGAQKAERGAWFAGLLLLLVGCARSLPVEEWESRQIVLARDAVIIPCAVRDSTTSLWFKKRKAWCLGFQEAPSDTPAHRVPAGTHLDIVSIQEMAGVDANWKLYRLSWSETLGISQSDRLYMKESSVEFNDFLLQRPSKPGV